MGLAILVSLVRLVSFVSFPISYELPSSFQEGMLQFEDNKYTAVSFWGTADTHPYLISTGLLSLRLLMESVVE